MTIEINTESVSPQERFRYWRESLRGLYQARVQTEPQTCSEFHATLSEYSIGRVALVEMAGAPFTVSSDGSSVVAKVTALVQLSGSSLLKQDGRESELLSGDFCLYRSRRPLELNLQAPFRIVAVRVPEDELAALSPGWEQALARTIPGNRGAPAVFLDTIRSLQRSRDSLEHPSSEGIADSILHLLAAVVCFINPHEPDCCLKTRYHLERVKKFVRSNLGNPDLNVELIARAVRLSPRHIHRLFSTESMSLMEWIWAQRLENCHRQLRQADSRERSICDLAYSWGFNDQAHFSRAFRKRFGRSPTQARTCVGAD